ncbi:MAG: VWA domain-containing protein, partial [Candidatus Hydrogenedentes bacterium]|nr:VWA domain-containing protein [Candidatus Hydrogenedentota bacterium]
MNQLHWWIIGGVVILVAAGLVLRRLERRRHARIDAFVDAKLAPRLVAGNDAAVRRPLFWLPLLGLALLLIALAQPRWGQSWVQVQQPSRDILVLLDTSESMNAEAVSGQPHPTRLERARQKLDSMLLETPGDRYGLVAFAGSAELQCPLTNDHAYFKAVLDAVDTDILSTEGTDIGEAIYEALRVFEEEDAAEARQSTRAIVVFSDGEQVSGDAVEAAKRASELAGVYVMGIGDPEGTLLRKPDFGFAHLEAPNLPQTHLSKLDEDTLKEMAISGGGAYVRTTADNRDVAYIVGQLQGLEARAVESELRYRMLNRYQWFLAAAAALFAAEGA